MKKGRSVYTFQINCDVQLVDNMIKSYIQANGYILQNENGEQFYKVSDTMTGNRYFNYLISEYSITIYAWFKGAFGEFPIEQNNLNMMAIDYRNSLNNLFKEINKLNNGGINMNENKNCEIKSQTQNNVNQFTKTFENETIKKQEKLCEIGFWLSIFGLLGAFTGVTYGIFVYILIFYFASQGLKTSKKKKAKTSIVLAIISIIIVVLQII